MEEKFHNYLNFVKDARSYNNQLSNERKLRMPFIDTQTGIAQRECSLWRSSYDRRLVAGKGCQGILYSYPASRWCKRRREYLMKPAGLPANGHYSLASGQQQQQQQLQQLDQLDAYSKFKQDLVAASCSGQPKTDHNSGIGHHNNGLASSSSSSLAGSQLRADSTGSHSCSNTADSDSRDLSLATSQSSFDSPKGLQAHDEEHDCSHEFENRLTLTAANSINGFMETASAEQEAHLNGEGPSMARPYERFPKNQTRDQGLENQTKAAIKLHSKMSKRKNVGQSLMSNSILLKDIRKTSSMGGGGGGAGGGSCSNGNIDARRTHHQQDQVHDQVAEGSSSMGLSADCINGKRIPEQAKANNDQDRPYVCTLCDQTYKTRPGLSYHFLHSHNATLPKNLPVVRKKEPKRSNPATGKGSGKCETPTRLPAQTVEQAISERQRNPSDSSSTKGPTPEIETNSSSVGLNEQPADMLDLDKRTDHGPDVNGNGTYELSELTNGKDRTAMQSTNMDSLEEISRKIIHREPNGCGSSKQESHTKTSLKQNPFCDFCLGTVEKNRRTRLPEQLVSCSRCGSSGHPSCLRFSDNIIISIRKYDWQCIECKTCSTCNNADNEHQLLFCDDCDRSYHTYCLSPPLAELPEGNWSCISCLKEYHHEEIKETAKT